MSLGKLLDIFDMHQKNFSVKAQEVLEPAEPKLNLERTKSLL